MAALQEPQKAEVLGMDFIQGPSSLPIFQFKKGPFQATHTYKQELNLKNQTQLGLYYSLM